METNKSFIMAERLKQLRESKKLSHEKLSKALSEKYGIKISSDSLMNYEVSEENHSKSYKNLGMRVEYLYCLADFYGVSADWILGISDVKSPSIEIQAICKFTGLSETAVMNLHTESKDEAAIFALSKLLSNDYKDLHRLNLQVHKALIRIRNCPHKFAILHPLATYIPDDRKAEFFTYLEKWGGETLNPREARDYYVSQAAYIFQRMVRNAGKDTIHVDLDDINERLGL